MEPTLFLMDKMVNNQSTICSVESICSLGSKWIIPYTLDTREYHFWIKYGMIFLFTLITFYKIWRENKTQQQVNWIRPSINLEELDHEWRNEKLSTKKEQTNIIDQAKEEAPKRTRQTIVRDMGIFKNGQLIRHKYRGDTWIGLFHEENLTIRMDEEDFFSASGFAKRHIEFVVARDQIGRKTIQSNGWTACEVLIAGNWMTLDDYSRLL
jgi:hypothetical protein